TLFFTFMDLSSMFQSARSLLENKKADSAIILPNKKENKAESELQDKIEYYRNKGTVKNTVKATQNWVTRLETFRKLQGYDTPIEMITDTR
ncbi:25446_t:CDS:1, partial [Racocetra persica]